MVHTAFTGVLHSGNFIAILSAFSCACLGRVGVGEDDAGWECSGVFLVTDAVLATAAIFV